MTHPAEKKRNILTLCCRKLQGKKMERMTDKKIFYTYRIVANRSKKSGLLIGEEENYMLTLIGDIGFLSRCQNIKKKTFMNSQNIKRNSRIKQDLVKFIPPKHQWGC